MMRVLRERSPMTRNDAISLLRSTTAERPSGLAWRVGKIGSGDLAKTSRGVVKTGQAASRERAVVRLCQCTSLVDRPRRVLIAFILAILFCRHGIDVYCQESTDTSSETPNSDMDAQGFEFVVAGMQEERAKVVLCWIGFGE